MSKVLESRSAIVTGASQGLGLAIARAYVEAGASVLICARGETLLEKALSELRALALPGQSVVALPADVSKEAVVAAWVPQSKADFGPLQAPPTTPATLSPSRPPP